MSGEPLDLLIVEDSAPDAEIVLRELHRGGILCAPRIVATEPALLQALAVRRPALVLSDFRLAGFDGARALAIVRESARDVPFILVSGTVGDELVASLLRSGATDFVPKSSLNRLAPAVQRALREREELRARQQAEEELRLSHEQLARANQELLALNRFSDSQNRQLRLLLGMAHALLKPMSVQERAREALVELMDSLAADGASFSLADQESRKPEHVAVVGVASRSREGQPNPCAQGTGLQEQVLRSGVAAVVDDYAAADHAEPALLRAGVRSLMTAPIVLSGKVLGILSVHSTTVGFFSPERAAFVKGVAEGLGALFESARLHEDLGK